MSNSIHIKRILLILILFFSLGKLMSHQVEYGNKLSRHWSFINAQPELEGTLFMVKEGKVFIEDGSNKIVSFPISTLSVKDQLYVNTKLEKINRLNKKLEESLSKSQNIQTQVHFKWALLLLLLASILCLFCIPKEKFKYILPIVLFGSTISLFSFKQQVLKRMAVTTNPSSIDLAFEPFKPNVNTFWDSNYFYVESLGLPTTHNMMVGISDHGWQQQVPVTQCYRVANAWPIPLNPTIAANPVPVNADHFSRGAIAVAVNGIAIFNPYTNTGVDAFLDGQLDSFGGHCGRADDYHYHTAPMHLYGTTQTTLPIAYALDGFAVYGNFEPDGTPMQSLDPNHGHYGANGVYHYHGSTAAPYMIGNMVGQVTEDATHQIIPQAAAQSIRPALTPLKGALITSCSPNANKNGFNVTYAVGSQIDSVVYNWSITGLYTYKYYHSGVLDSTKTYNKTAPCVMPTTALNDRLLVENGIALFPNPVSDYLTINLNNSIAEKDIQDISIYTITGDLVFRIPNYKANIDLRNLSKGAYILCVHIGTSQMIKQIQVK